MLKFIAVAGGIGSGKSTVCDALEKSGYFVLRCDDINRCLWNDSKYINGFVPIVRQFDGFDEVMSCFMREVKPTENEKITHNIVVNAHPDVLSRAIRAYLRCNLPINEELRLKVNAYSHPKINKQMFKEALASRKEIVFAEIPLLNGADMRKYYDAVIFASLPDAERIKRITVRDSIDEITARARMDMQTETPLPTDIIVKTDTAEDIENFIINVLPNALLNAD